ncbi:hypothetical protein [Thermoactinomyces sp. DSM 45892]|uniref:hypothetical protein n=1 Tax=Thermoactinomyces sp. DSM 45892 TaxID=1882753 RepID=UPI0008962861|nr:hypothetical protein [Thermoactinomyces sp. DSM 45892]SDY87497.1 hypothetical protein SAMN05444416_109137 [Thermoactinomyces sp. DSM 45892]
MIRFLNAQRGFLALLGLCIVVAVCGCSSESTSTSEPKKIEDQSLDEVEGLAIKYWQAGIRGDVAELESIEYVSEYGKIEDQTYHNVQSIMIEQSGAVYITTLPEGPNEKEVYAYVSPEMTNGKLLKKFDFRKVSGGWKLSSIQEYKVGRNTFQHFTGSSMYSMEFGSKPVSEWKEVTLKK